MASLTSRPKDSWAIHQHVRERRKTLYCRDSSALGNDDVGKHSPYGAPHSCGWLLLSRGAEALKTSLLKTLSCSYANGHSAIWRKAGHRGQLALVSMQ